MIALCILLTGAAQAHDPGLSSIDLRIGKQRITADLTLAPSDAQLLAPAAISAPPAESRLEEIAGSALEVEVDRRPVPPVRIEIQIDETSALHFLIEFRASSGSRVRLRSRIIARLPRGHRQYVSVTEERAGLIGERMLDAKNDSLEVSLANSGRDTRLESITQFLVLGVRHILTGYDHLVFLLGLMIASAGFRDIAKMITSFTLAHSITLGLATLEVVRVSPGVVEPFIAISIMYVGLENVLRRSPKRRWVLTFGFGLVHGFGFAFVLNELGIGAGAGAAAPLMSFNVGVELGQIAIALVALPLIWKLKQRPGFSTRCVPVCSILISLAGAAWLLQRTLLK